jgi:hypothetical protein
VSNDPWGRATFGGTEQAQADVIAELTPDERLVLLEQLLDIAEASGALQRAREDKQRQLDEAWATTLEPAPQRSAPHVLDGARGGQGPVRARPTRTRHSP